MKRSHVLLLGLCLLILCFAVLCTAGREYTVEMWDLHGEGYNNNPGVVEILSDTSQDGVRQLHLRALRPGQAAIDGHVVYVHRLGFITDDTFFGNCTGDIVIPLSAAVFLAAILARRIRLYRESVRADFYQYRNITNLSVVLLVSGMLANVLFGMLGEISPIGTVRATLNGASLLADVLLPVAFVSSILVTVSCIRLMRREGRTWRNMLACMLGVLICLATIFPYALGEWLQRTTIVDVHNERGVALLLELIVENTVIAVVAWLDCVLVSTIIFAVRAARRVPAFDKDYMIIHGSQIRADGTLTNLLKGRADRAIEFARMQREATGKELIFIPSGGKGADECISEGEAIRNYLLEQGIPASQILAETASASTAENLRFSMDLIRARDGDAAEDKKIAISTTNYHVFRAGLLASEQGMRAEGIGSPTKRYFWINAFVREYIATLYTERRTHLRILLSLLLLALSLVGVVYLSHYL